MNIEDMAHDFVMAALANPTVKLDSENLSKIVSNSWVYAEAMQAEFNKRKPQGLPEAIQDDFQVDWSLAPSWAEYWAINLDCSSYWYINKPSIIEYGWESNGGLISGAPSFNYFSYSDKCHNSLRQRP